MLRLSSSTPVPLVAQPTCPTPHGPRSEAGKETKGRRKEKKKMRQEEREKTKERCIRKKGGEGREL